MINYKGKIGLLVMAIVVMNGCSLIKRPFFIKNKKKEARKEKREEKKIEKDIAKGKIDSTAIVPKDTLAMFPTDTQLARSFFSERAIDYTTFQAKVKMHYEGLEDKQNFTANFRMEKNKVIWVSITGFEIEVARAMITPDSVKAIERINKKYYLYSYSDIQKLIGLSVNFQTLQDLIVGNVIATQGKITEVKNVQDVLTTFIRGNDFINQITFTKKDTSLKQIQLQTQREVSTSSLLISMSQYLLDKGIMFSTMRDYSIQDIKGAASLNMEFKKYEFNQAMDFPFSIPASYKAHIESTSRKQ